jgi:polyisoprenoid-binding protein YceI
MAKLPGRLSKRLAVLVLAGGLGLIVMALLLVYFVIFPTSSPKPFKLTSSTASSTISTSGAATQSTPAAQLSGNSQLSGNWKVASGSQAGYRVREQLAFLPAQSDAVGRTSQITGRASFIESNGSVTITTASFDVAVNTLKSDRSMRDEKIHEIGLESSRFPTATFALSTPLTLSASALEGKVARVSATGTFNIHGTSRLRTLPVELSLSGATFEAAGSLTFLWSEFGMTAPSIGGFVNVTEHATMEFDLRLQRA